MAARFRLKKMGGDRLFLGRTSFVEECGELRY